MSKLVWDKVGERFYETGVDRGVLYQQEGTTYPKGVAWNGLTAFEESPEGAETTSLYADNQKYLNMVSAENFKGTLTAYMYPDEFEECDGSKEIAPGITVGQQARKSFGLSYRTKIGSDTDGDAHGYKIHLVYGCTAAPSSRSNQTVGDSPEAMELSWEINTTPVPITAEVAGKTLKSTATLVIDSTKTSAEALKKLEDVIYGTESAEPRLPLPDEVISIVGSLG